LANPDDSLLPEKSVDLVFVRNVYHHLPSPEKYFQALIKKLKPGGRVAIVEYGKLGFFSLIRIFGHCAAEEEVIETLGELDTVWPKDMNSGSSPYQVGKNTFKKRETSIGQRV